MPEATLTDLPDYPSLERLASALWNEGQARGAAVLVGAGFSRNAELAGEDTKTPPLWSDLREGMAEILYPGRSADAPKDALRLAEEFRIYLGQEALVEFIRSQVPDQAWSPGKLHKALMGLPWAEVLTTNYDTLLERASPSHKAVIAPADLARIRGRRVVKLHGSIEANARLVIAEDDYRIYPVDSAAFVNTARQVFLENELCLLGFSGDDPNFLQWSGWVRDHLGESARRIYLVGSLDLSPAKRRLLESRNVAPIDFAIQTRGLPRQEAERKSCELFLDFLSRRKPRRAVDWRPASREAYVSIPQDPRIIRVEMEDGPSRNTLLRKLSEIWHVDASGCPDWLVPPRAIRREISFGTRNAPPGLVRVLGLLEVELRVALLRQLVWRGAKALDPLGADLRSAIASSIDGFEADAAGRAELLLASLCDARLRRDEGEFNRLGSLIAADASLGSNQQASLAVQRLLWARDGLDLASVAAGLSTLAGPDPLWGLVKVSLHYECGELIRASELLSEVRADLLDRNLRDPSSMWVSSRLAWAEVFARALRMTHRLGREEDEPARGQKLDYDPIEEIEAARSEMRTSRLRQMNEPKGYQPRFAPGTFKDHTRTITFREPELGYEAETIFRLADASCLPVRIDHTDVFASTALDALESEPVPTLTWHLRLLRVVGHGSPAIERRLNEISIARLDAGLAAELTARLLAEARFWHPRARSARPTDRAHATERWRVCLEMLSRFIVRAEPEAALEAFRFVHELCLDIGQLSPLLCDPIGDLLKWCLLSLPPDRRPTLVLDCLELPLPPSDHGRNFHWPDPASELFARQTIPVRPSGDTRWTACVAALLAAADERGARRAMAVHRLAYLATHGVLEAAECCELGRTIWSVRAPDRGGLPLDVDLYPHVIASLPGTAGVHPREVVARHLFDHLLTSPGDAQMLDAVRVAATKEKFIPPMPASREQAVALLDALAAHETKRDEGSEPLAALARGDARRIARRVLGSVILPALEAGDVDPTRLAYVKSCMRPGEGGGALEGAHELARLAPDQLSSIVSNLRRAIGRGDIHDATGACRSVVRWMAGTGSGLFVALPDALKEAVIASLELGGLAALQPRLWCARKLLEAETLSPTQIERLAELLPGTWDDLDYSRMPTEGFEAVGITLARAECMRLAEATTAAGYQVEGVAVDYEGDPLPEVRFAVVEAED